MLTATCPRCPIRAEIHRGPKPNTSTVSYDLPGMLDKCVVLSGQLASTGSLSIGDEPDCPHLKSAILGALNRGR